MSYCKTQRRYCNTTHQDSEKFSYTAWKQKLRVSSEKIQRKGKETVQLLVTGRKMYRTGLLVHPLTRRPLANAVTISYSHWHARSIYVDPSPTVKLHLCLYLLIWVIRFESTWIRGHWNVQDINTSISFHCTNWYIKMRGPQTTESLLDEKAKRHGTWKKNIFKNVTFVNAHTHRNME